jgi:6-phosphogluconolactonase
MANKMNLVTFHTKDELFSAANELIIKSLKSDGKILLSGGATPAPLYRLLSKSTEHLPGLHWGLVDERFVPFSDPNSNEKMIREALGPEATITGMIYNVSDYESNLEEVNLHYQPFIEHTDICVLGMGPDGHTASVFPGDPSSELILSDTRVGIFNTNAPGFPQKRITCSPAMLVKSSLLLLMIFGEEKKNVLMETSRNLPIHQILSIRPDTFVYYAD